MWPFGKRIGIDAEVASLLAEAHALAHSFGHDFLGVEHLFLSFRQLPKDHQVGKILTHFEIDLPKFFADLELQTRTPIDRLAPKNLPRTIRLKRILKMAERFACLGTAPMVTASHLLVAIMFERESVPARLLSEAYQATHPELPETRLLADTLLQQLLFGTFKNI